MIKNFPKILIPTFLIIICIILIILLQINILNSDNETIGYNSLLVVVFIIYILLPLQVLLFIFKILYKVWKQFND